MRTSHTAAALASVAAGLAAAATLRRLAAHRVSPAASVTTAAPASAGPVQGSDADVLPFSRPVAAGPTPEHVASPVRCGDSGGRTKGGAPCAARITTGGRCHHHPMAA